MTVESFTKDQEMTLRDYYDNLPDREHIAPKKEFVQNIAAICFCAESTVRAWLSGTQKPDPLKQKTIAEYLGLPVEKLFPKEA